MAHLHSHSCHSHSCHSQRHYQPPLTTQHPHQSGQSSRCRRCRCGACCPVRHVRSVAATVKVVRAMLVMHQSDVCLGPPPLSLFKPRRTSTMRIFSSSSSSSGLSGPPRRTRTPQQPHRTELIVCTHTKKTCSVSATVEPFFFPRCTISAYRKWPRAPSPPPFCLPCCCWRQRCEHGDAQREKKPGEFFFVMVGRNALANRCFHRHQTAQVTLACSFLLLALGWPSCPLGVSSAATALQAGFCIYFF